MGSRSTFTHDEWRELQWAVMLAGSHVSAVDWSGWWGRLQEATSGSRVLRARGAETESQLVADLARDQAHRHPPDAADRESLASDAALAHIRRATGLVEEKAPEDLGAFQDLVFDVAEAMAASVDDVSEEEVAALIRIQDALGLDGDSARD